MTATLKLDSATWATVEVVLGLEARVNPERFATFSAALKTVHAHANRTSGHVLTALDLGTTPAAGSVDGHVEGLLRAANDQLDAIFLRPASLLPELKAATLRAGLKWDTLKTMDAHAEIQAQLRAIDERRARKSAEDAAEERRRNDEADSPEIARFAMHGKHAMSNAREVAAEFRKHRGNFSGTLNEYLAMHLRADGSRFDGRTR